MRFQADDAHRVRRVVAADVEKVLDLVRLQDLEDFLAVTLVGLVACGAQRRRWRVGDQFKVVAGFLRQVHEVLIDDAAHAVARAVDARDLSKPPRLQRHADQRLVDHRRRAAALGDENFSGCHGFFPLVARWKRSASSYTSQWAGQGWLPAFAAEKSLVEKFCY